MNPDILFDGQHVQVLHFPRGSRITLLTFDIMHARANRRNAFAKALCEKLDISLVAMVPHHPCWYPAAEMRAIAPICQGILANRGNVIAYGASMGGYGALRWGKALGATHALACSPQYSIDPDDIGPQDKRFARHFDKDLHEDMTLRAEHMPPTSVVVYDPRFRPDALNAAMLRNLGAGTYLPAHHMGHGTAKCISGSANALAIFEGLLASDMAAIRCRITKRRRSDPRYFYNLAGAALNAGKTDLSATIAGLARAADPAGFHMHMARHWATLAQPQNAASHYEEVLKIRPRHPQAILKLRALRPEETPPQLR